MLNETLAPHPVEGTYAVEVLADPRCHRASREAWLAVRFRPVTLRRPRKVDAHDAIERLTTLAVMVTLRLLPLHIGRADESLSASVTLSEPQQQCLEQLMPTLQGRTRKQQNPFSPGSLPWAT